ncbi:cytochrome o ubiquinol oxidase subunit III [Cupriavidus metallidurans]|jgi:cytochrome o ubiquinol oxidase subunit 3|uniref:Cytochrome bo(3) ubiquinol oxidase subunit 3 n=1 Tax=Cupriavidus metallidurans (strain ATCC 43123 / DSM 2839 / NBRC 102507 / CH34) TaxID=266264 RepID=Q1LB26_CUPMC|nr:cytochrome o ubiquinol oxidase subunit III [Cupriavidus metallidurans]ABF12650.1 cytochrome o ubiquinol oxidase subunit III [Cupriavidus metallidurans CH34]AVA35312.1 cytochrome o ubiquinol oxidase subunit III [Cupriavidus metallidurans]KWW33090.1 Cytochrome bo(3) ubiquinol oxidase subunit 3 [Cupriavidus metallidurans]MDE4921080.1 cytochrome o ubiquinol oxidase subunit III [Cupriavidus metallidurans]QGS32156.1 cytochrome o ubiquinol oxidase subunit III [Cupriavidus metallidurans]
MTTSLKLRADAAPGIHAPGHASDAHGHDAAHGHDGHDDHVVQSRTTLGFWLYLMSDCLIFAVLFATFGVLVNNTAGGPGGRELFDLRFVLGETMLLLTSSLTFGVAMIKLEDGKANPNQVIRWIVLTFALGAAFVGMEIFEFMELIHEGAGPGRSAYLSAFFMLVGTHGLHVTAGLLWIIVMVHQIQVFGLDGIVRRRLACLSLFWHFLDLVWICVFSIVYLRTFL